MTEPDAPSHAVRFASLLSTVDEVDSIVDRFCEASQLMLDADGAAITVNYGRPHRHTVSTTSALALLIEDAQDVSGEGPGFDADRTGTVVSGCFGRRTATSWPLLEDSISGLDFTGTILALPISAAGTKLGVLVAHRLETPLTFDEEVAAFLSVSLGAALLDRLSPEQLQRELTEDWPVRAIVHQATGMVLTQLGVRPDDALALLRAHAYALDLTLMDVAVQVVERELRFDSVAEEGQ